MKPPHANLLRCVLLALSAMLFWTGEATLAGEAVLGKAAPACEGTAIGDAPSVNLADTLGTKVVYVDFWASWCGPCAKAFPFLNALDREFRDRGLKVVGINVDEKAADALGFLRRNRADFALLKDAGGACPRAFGVAAMPTSYLIDRRGIVREVHVGFRDSDAAQRRLQVEQLLAETPAKGK